MLLKFDTPRSDIDEEDDEEFAANSENDAFVRSWFPTGVIIDNADTCELPCVISFSLGVIV